MKKIPTIYPKDPNDLGLVVEAEPMKGIKYFQVKIDGTSCMIKDGKPYCRLDIKLFKKKNGKIVKTFTKEELQKKIPEGAIACQEPDEKSGHWPHWTPVLENNPEHKYILEGFNNIENKIDGTYECIGPKINGNPHNMDRHVWVYHLDPVLRFNLDIYKYGFVYIKGLFEDEELFQWEGLVAYNEKNEPIGKIRRSDFGLKKITYKNKGF